MTGTLAGATVVNHVLECGAQATGGNYAFFEEIYNVKAPGFPIAEIRADGSSVITKHDGTGGAVTTETVTAQLLYEIGGPSYAGPDVTTRFDTIELAQDGPDRVRISGVRGTPPPPSTKVCLNHLGGHRNEMTFVLTGLGIEAKAESVKAHMAAAFGDAPPARVEWTLLGTAKPDPATQGEATVLLRCAVLDPDPDKVGRAFSNAAVELALAGYPGFTMTSPPGRGARTGSTRPLTSPMRRSNTSPSRTRRPVSLSRHRSPLPRFLPRPRSPPPRWARKMLPPSPHPPGVQPTPSVNHAGHAGRSDRNCG